MKRKHFTLKVISVFLILSLVLTSCLPGSNKLSEKKASTRESFETLLDELFASSFEDDLISLHYTLKDPESYGIKKPEKAFSSISVEENDTAIKELKETKKALSLLKRSHLSENQQVLYDYLTIYIDQQITLSQYPEFVNPLSVHQGISSNLPLTLTEYAFYTEEDVKDYLNILTEIPSVLNEALLWETDRASTDISMSKFELQDTAAQIDTFLSSSDILITSFQERLDGLTGLSKDQKKTYRKNNEKLVTDTVIPAFENLKEGLKTLEKTAPEGYGLAHYEKGKEYFEILVKSMTMSDRSVDTLISTLEKRLDSLNDRIIDTIMTYPDVYDIFYSGQTYTDASPEEMLKQLEENILDFYPDLPDVAYTVEPIPDALKNASTAAYYMIPPLDGTEENRIFYGDNTEDSASFFMTLAHEGYPGHLYHQNYLLQKDFHPIYHVLNDTGYKEAWAFYVENQMASYCDFGIYEEEYHEALTELYRCNSEFSYCISSLVDLYINGKDYSRENISDFLVSAGLDETSTKAIYEFAVEEPGAYLQYYIGYLELLSIQEDAEEVLGYDFDAKEFHQEILDFGPCFFTQLTKHMTNWSKKALR